jgi:AcrR family transcriptional regulator
MHSGTYGGRSAGERVSDRRRRLVRAAIAIWGEQGWAAVTMRGVCARAGLIDRYFYESFTDRDALLVAVWDQLRDETIQVLWGAIADKRHEPPYVQLRAALTAYIDAVASHPDRARIAFGEHAGSAPLERRHRQNMQWLTDLFVMVARPYLLPATDEVAFRTHVLMAIGGFVELLTAWQARLIRIEPPQIVEHALAFASLLGARYVSPALLRPTSSRRPPKRRRRNAKPRPGQGRG